MADHLLPFLEVRFQSETGRSREFPQLPTRPPEYVSIGQRGQIENPHTDFLHGGGRNSQIWRRLDVVSLIHVSKTARAIDLKSGCAQLAWLRDWRDQLYPERSSITTGTTLDDAFQPCRLPVMLKSQRRVGCI